VEAIGSARPAPEEIDSKQRVREREPSIMASRLNSKFLGKENMRMGRGGKRSSVLSSKSNAMGRAICKEWGENKHRDVATAKKKEYLF